MRCLIVLVSLALASTCMAQTGPVKWSFKAEKVSELEYNIILKADIANGWSVYSQNLAPSSTPVPTTIIFNTQKGARLIGETEEIGLKKEEKDFNSGEVLVKYQRMAQFTQRIKIEPTTTAVSGQLTYMTCDDQGCLPPTNVDFAVLLD